MDHIRESQLGHFNGKGFDLAGPHRADAVSYRRQGEAADSIEQAAHGQFVRFLIKYSPPTTKNANRIIAVGLVENMF